MSLAEILLTNAAVIAAVMLLTWLPSLRLRDASIVDMLWGAGFVVIAWVTFAMTDGGVVNKQIGRTERRLRLPRCLPDLRLVGYVNPGRNSLPAPRNQLGSLRRRAVAVKIP